MAPSHKHITVALAGNPNSGKTTIFNNLTGANQHVGNFPGVTVEKKEGHLIHGGYRIKLIDLPGTYSLSAGSLDEIIARNYIIDNKPDIVVDIVDASNIERNLYLSTQISELGIPMIIALNMSDTAQKRGINIDHKYLSTLLNIPVIPTIGNKRKGMAEILEKIIDTAENGQADTPAKVKYGKEFQDEICKLCDLIKKDNSSTNSYRPKWLALKLIENDREIMKYLIKHKYSDDLFRQAAAGRKHLQAIYGDEPASVITDKRYGFISGACSEATSMTAERRQDISDSIDNLLIHPNLGLPIFAILMWLVFQLTFSLGEKPMALIEWVIGGVSYLAATYIPEGLVNSLIVDGIIGGVGGVIVFLPNIMLLFLAIAILEDTGYMARAAFIMDRIMHKIGLHGKSFIPMLIGFGCTVPAFMGSRIIDDKTDRLVTMHVTNFMSCGARLPVYILVCGAFWPHNAGTVVFSIYAIGVVIAIIMVKVLRGTRFKGMSSPLVMELPPYRMPTFRSLFLHMWERSWLYLRKAGTIILSVSIVMWFLMTFPENSNYSRDFSLIINNARSDFDSGQIGLLQRNRIIEESENLMVSENLENSIAGRLGKLIEPVIEPLGFDWRLGIAMISGFAAKEVVVSTMGTVYGVGEVDESSQSLRNNLAGDPKYSKLIAYSFLVFILLYVPCMAAMAVFLRESGSWKETVFQFSYTFGLAWVISFAIYQGGKFLGLG
ncbi:MAG: ferrous iron transport protein B [candidate division Zixibacteria bacterium]|nr:ferrous iron transport protein B [candidate division Zixibacteria bacterium]